MVGIEFADPKLAEEVQWASFKRGLLVLECGKQTVRMCPPLIATTEDIETAVRIFGEAVEAVATHPAEIARQAEAAHSMHDGEVDG
jgi:4-aminobutyrate aminotransferase